MFAIVRMGGKQYQVTEKSKLKVEKMIVAAGSSFATGDVLLVSESEDNVEIGTPYVSGMMVEFKVLGDVQGEKVRVFKKKAKKRYQKTTGHRQKYTELEVVKIGKGSAKMPELPKMVVAEKPAVSEGDGKVEKAEKKTPAKKPLKKSVE